MTAAPSLRFLCTITKRHAKEKVEGKQYKIKFEIRRNCMQTKGNMLTLIGNGLSLKVEASLFLLQPPLKHQL